MKIRDDVRIDQSFLLKAKPTLTNEFSFGHKNN